MVYQVEALAFDRIGDLSSTVTELLPTGWIQINLD